jgi:hypothetical protein
MEIVREEVKNWVGVVQICHGKAAGESWEAQAVSALFAPTTRILVPNSRFKPIENSKGFSGS